MSQAMPCPAAVPGPQARLRYQQDQRGGPYQHQQENQNVGEHASDATTGAPTILPM